MLKQAVLLTIILMWARNASSNPSSEWIYVANSYDDDMYFVHEPTVMVDKNYVEFWQLINYATTQRNNGGITYLSTKSLSVTDCLKRTNNVKEVIFFTEASGEGKVADRIVLNGESEGKAVIAPGSVGEGVFHAVCGKKTAKGDAKTKQSIEEQVEKAKNNNPYLVHWEASDPAAWGEALRQDDVLRTTPVWSEKPYEDRFREVVRRVRLIMPTASKPPKN